MKNFKELKIWQKGIEIAIDAYKLSEHFPPSERFGLSSQITRAAVSISSNIAEGSSRKSIKDYNRFLEMSLGSTFELETQIIISQKIGLGNEELIQKILQNVIEEQKMLSSFMKTIQEN